MTLPEGMIVIPKSPRRPGKSHTPRRLVEELAAVGVQVDDVWDLVFVRTPYGAAIPVLARWLTDIEQEVTNTRTRAHLTEALVRSLTVPEARGRVTQNLLTRLQTAENDAIRWAIGNACTVVATSDDLDAILDVLHNSGMFSANLKGFVECLGRIAASDPAKVRDYLIRALDDEHLQGDALIALFKLRICDAVDHVRSTLLTDDRVPVRRAAQRYIQSCVEPS